MGYDLCGRGGSFSTSLRTYPALLGLAFHFGWKPMCTQIDGAGYQSLYGGDEQKTEQARRNWRGGYTSNDHQWVTDDDARAIADAIDSALVEVPPAEVENVLFSPVLMLPAGTSPDVAAQARAERPTYVILVEGQAQLPDGNVIAEDDYWARISELSSRREGLLAIFSGPGGRALLLEFADFARAGGYFTA
jgi:hypothetical protein